MTGQFVNLHHHDTFSRLDGYGYPEDAAAYAAELGMPALAQTNHGNMYGSWKHWKACIAQGIKPILGMEAYVAPGDRTVREIVKWGEVEDGGKLKVEPRHSTHLTVLAVDATGLRNLYRLHAKAFTEGYYYYPRIDRELIAQHSEGLIILSGCAGSEISTRLRLGQYEQARAAAGWHKDLLGDRFYLEVMHHDLPFEPELNAGLFRLSRELGIPAVATQDSHYVRESDKDVHDALLCVQTGAQVSAENRFRFSGEGYHLRNAVGMLRSFAETPDAVYRSGEIAERVGDYAEVFQYRNLMPEGDPARLGQLAKDGLIRLHLEDPEYWDRLDYELKVINQMGYAGYFLTIREIILFARSAGIVVGPGRGSGAGSLVAYALGITGIDPLHHGLLFERFLNPGRKSPPDLDIDFQDDRQEEIFQYAVQTFGLDRTCRVLTLSTIGAKAAIADAARVLGYTPSVAAKLKAQLPSSFRGRKVRVEDAPNLPEDVRRLALHLEGQVRTTGMHPSALVVSPVPLAEVIPVKRDPRDPCLVSGVDMKEVEVIGLVKNDFLGLKTLTTLNTALGMIKGSR